MFYYLSSILIMFMHYYENKCKPAYQNEYLTVLKLKYWIENDGIGLISVHLLYKCLSNWHCSMNCAYTELTMRQSVWIFLEHPTVGSCRYFYALTCLILWALKFWLGLSDCTIRR